MKEKRILWLINHTTLREFELPLLEELGYEIYTPKIFPFDEANMSASIDYSYDDKLTISKEEIDILNKVDFYTFIPKEAQEIINKNFSIAMFPFFPEMFKELVEKFNGILILRAFGILEGSYTSLTCDLLGYAFLEKLEKIKERFWFGQGYEHLKEMESGIFKDKSIYLPIGLKNAYSQDKWIGRNDNIFFICPRINTNTYYNQVYKDFKNNFKEFNFLIGGAQPIKVNDERVLGYIERKKYDELFLNSKVMFYHSTYKNHIHYHPFEAIKLGMPLVFMAGGMLDELGGRKLPGRCKNILEAKKKIRKIIKGDKKFIEKIKKTQVILLNKVSLEFCKPIWEKNLQKIKEISNVNVNLQNKKIAIILPHPYKGETLDYSKMLVKSIKAGIDDDGLNIDLIFGYVKSNIYDKNEFKDLEEIGIKIREFVWEEFNKDRLMNLMQIKGYKINIDGEFYAIPNDGINYFLDCDFWIFTTDRLPKEILPIKEYAVCVHDYIQRYIPALFENHFEKSFIKAVRNAKSVFVTTPQTMEDCINYAGIRRRKIKLLPLMFEKEKINYIETEKIEEKLDYFLWTTNLSIHKNNLAVLKAIKKYYEKGGIFNCYVTGVDTDLFDVSKKVENINNPYLLQVRNFIEKNKSIFEKVKFLGELPKEKYYDILSNAKFLLHAAIIDNGTYCVLEAAVRGVPSISSDYPAMRYISEMFNLKCKFFNQFDYDELSEVLLEAEKRYKDWQRELPKKSDLIKHSIEENYYAIWEKVKETIGI